MNGKHMIYILFPSIYLSQNILAFIDFFNRLLSLLLTPIILGASFIWNQMIRCDNSLMLLIVRKNAALSMNTIVQGN